ncbi:lamin tail domain-containing protein [Candidatus Woesearchaeota archaeon]|nr:lamin tail domain-containing protein [Candidatus Woesearchaeota archaeon]
MKNKGAKSLLLVILIVILSISMASFAKGEILINEFLADSNFTGSAEDKLGEWIEIYNNGTSEVNLNNWVVEVSSEQNFTIDTFFTISPQGFAVLAHNFSFFNNTNPEVNESGVRIFEYGSQNSGFILTNSDDFIVLFNSSGNVTDNVSYGGSNANISAGRFPDGSANIINLSVQTPGAANDNLPPTFNSWLNGLKNNSNISSIVNITVNITDQIYTVNTSFLNFNNSNFSMDKDGDLWNFTWNTLLNTDGKYNLTVSFNDSVGLASTSILYNITVDNTNPSVSFVTISSGANVSGMLNITITSIDTTTGTKTVTLKNGANSSNIVSMSLLGGNLNNNNWTYVINTSALSDGKSNFTINATDFVGNYNFSEFVEITIDNTAPIVSINSPSNNTNISGTFVINVTVTDAATAVNSVFFNITDGSSNIILSAGNNNANDWNASHDSATLSDGSHNITVYATDFTGNLNKEKFLTVVSDNTNPTVFFIRPQNNTNVSGTINVTITASEGTAGVKTVSLRNGTGGNLGSMSLLGGNINAGNWTLQFDTSILTDGNHNLTINATDFAGNSNNELFVTLTADNSGPAVTFITPASNANLSGIQPVNVTISDATTSVANFSITLVNGSGIVLNFIPTQSGNDYSQSLNTSQFSDGSYNISVFANDTVGKTTNSNLIITIDNTLPVIKVVSPSNNSFVNNGFQQIIFNVTDATSGVKTSSINSSTFKYTFSGFTFSVNSITFDSISNGFFANGTVDLGSNEAKVNITATAQDNAGNPLSVFWTYTIDLSNPKVTSLNKNDTDSKVKSSTPLNITVNVTNGAAGIAAVNISNSSTVAMSLLSGDIWAVTTNVSQLGCTADGNCTITVNARDGAGNLNQSVTLTLLVDNLNPNVSNINISDTDLKVRSTDSIRINVTVNDTNFDSGSTVTVGNRTAVQMVLNSTVNQTTVWSLSTTPSAFNCSSTDAVCTIRFTATDIVGNVNNAQTLALTVDDIPPNVSISINSSTNVNNITVLKINVTAADTNTVSNVSINGTQLNNTGGNVWRTVNATYQLCPGVLDSSCTLLVTAFDEVGNSNSSQALTLSISSFSPVITGIPDITFNEDGHNATVNLSQFITDQDTQINDITVSAFGNSSVKVKINQTTKMLNVSAASDFNGQETIIFTASDGVNTDSDTVVVTVSAVNDAPTAPTLTSPANNSNVSSTTTALNWSASTDPESSSIIYYVFFSNTSVPSFNATTSSTGITVNNLTKAKTYYWKVIASDGSLNSSNSSTFQFLEVSNRAPANNGTIANVTLTEDTADTSIDLDNYFSDQDNDALSFTSTTPSNVAVSINSATHAVTLTPSSNFAGTNTITFTASDGTNSTSSNQVTLTVLNVNDAPTITSFSPAQNKTIASGTGSQRFEITFADVDSGDTPTASWFRNGTSIGPSNASNVTVTGLNVGIYNITAIVTDNASATARNRWTLTVSDIINSTELTSPILNLNETERQSAANITINQSTSGGIDFGTNTLNFSGVANLEDAFNISNGLISVDTNTYPGLNKSASLLMKGLNFTKAPLIFMASGFESTSNGALCPATICTNITYDNTNDILRFNVAHFTTFFTQQNGTNGAPVITSTASTSATLNQQYRYDVEAADPDGNTLNFSLTTAPSGMSISSGSGLITFTPASLGNFSVSVQVSDGNLTDTQSYSLIVGEGARLRITDLDIKVGSKSDKNVQNNSRIKKEAAPGDKISFDLEIKNFFTNDEDLEIEDIDVQITIEDIDDGDDLDGDASEFDLKAQKDDNVKIDFEVPLEVDEDTFDVLIEVEGRDENGTNHEIRWELQLDVEKENHEIRVLRATATPSEIKCQRTVSINTEIINTGADDEDDVTLEISSPELGINSVTNAIELDSGTDDNRFTKTATASISNDLLSGIYPIKVNTYYDGKLSSTETVNLATQQCEQVKDVREGVQEEKPKVEVITPAPKAEEQPEKPIEISFVNTDAYYILLSIMIVIFIGTAAFIIGSAFIVLKK